MLEQCGTAAGVTGAAVIREASFAQLFGHAKISTNKVKFLDVNQFACGDNCEDCRVNNA